MMNMTNYKRAVLYAFFLIIAGITGCSVPEENKNLASVHHIKNFYQVDAKLYRSTQPPKEAFVLLHKYGIRNVIDLRQWYSDADLVQETGVKHYKFPLNASKVTYEDLVKIVATIESIDGKVLVHCWHGSDRTGVVVAAYRIYNGWQKEKALEEFRESKYGHHEFWFPNLKKLLLSLDEVHFRKDVNKVMKGI